MESNEVIPSKKMYLLGGVIGHNPAYVEYLENRLKIAISLIERVISLITCKETKVLLKRFLSK